MGKCIFKGYQISLHGKDYEVLVPSEPITEMWVELWETTCKNGDWDYCIVNRCALQWLRNSYIALTQNPYRIIYFPIRNVEHICELRYTEIPPDFVLYTHQRQLNRREWKDIKKCMKYIKLQQTVVRFHIPTLFKDYERMMHQWRKKKTFYWKRKWRVHRDEEKLFYQHDTCFIESSVRQALYAAIEIQEALARDLESELEEHHYLQYTAGSRCGGISYEFATKEFLERREREEWKW